MTEPPCVFFLLITFNLHVQHTSLEWSQLVATEEQLIEPFICQQVTQCSFLLLCTCPSHDKIIYGFIVKTLDNTSNVLRKDTINVIDKLLSYELGILDQVACYFDSVRIWFDIVGFNWTRTDWAFKRWETKDGNWDDEKLGLWYDICFSSIEAWTMILLYQSLDIREKIR